jgi:RNA polymerase sigma-70 factor (ECF subfamily)
MASSPDRPLEPNKIEEAHAQLRPELVRFAWGILRDWALADDAVQNGFLSLTRFGGGVEPANRKSWLYKVVFREALRLRKSTATRQFDSTNQTGEPPATYQIDPAQRLLDAEESEWFRQQFTKLPEDQRTILELRIQHEKTFAEIAQMLGIPIGTALSRMRLAIQKLRELSHDH